MVHRSNAARGIHIIMLRLVEIYWAATRIDTLPHDIDLSDTNSAPVNPDESGKGIGVVEAPRGVLIQSYTINRGRTQRS